MVLGVALDVSRTLTMSEITVHSSHARIAPYSALQRGSISSGLDPSCRSYRGGFVITIKFKSLFVQFNVMQVDVVITCWNLNQRHRIASMAQLLKVTCGL